MVETTRTLSPERRYTLSYANFLKWREIMNNSAHLTRRQLFDVLPQDICSNI